MIPGSIGVIVFRDWRDWRDWGDWSPPSSCRRSLVRRRGGGSSCNTQADNPTVPEPQRPGIGMGAADLAGWVGGCERGAGAAGGQRRLAHLCHARSLKREQARTPPSAGETHLSQEREGPKQTGFRLNTLAFGGVSTAGPSDYHPHNFECKT